MEPRENKSQDMLKRSLLGSSGYESVFAIIFEASQWLPLSRQASSRSMPRDLTGQDLFDLSERLRTGSFHAILKRRMEDNEIGDDAIEKKKSIDTD